MSAAQTLIAMLAYLIVFALLVSVADVRGWWR